MHSVADLQEVIRQKRMQAHALHVLLPRFVIAQARQKHGVVHPFLELAEEHPEIPVIAAFAELLLEIGELEGQLAELEAALRTPDLRLGKIRRTA